MPKDKQLVNKIGDQHDVDGVLCIVRFVNQGIGFLFPMIDDTDESRLYRCCMYAKVYPNGETKK